MLYHVSEETGISVFVPRPSPLVQQPVVWAIDGAHLRNYLLPRNCPRVTYAAGPNTTAADRATFLEHDRPVVAIEAAWTQRVTEARLACYHLPSDSFEPFDSTAGYFISREQVVPSRVELIADPLARLLEWNVDLRVVPDLWPLHDAVAASTLEFSMIRMSFAHRAGRSHPP
jgi:hypothetical protein